MFKALPLPFCPPVQFGPSDVIAQSFTVELNWTFFVHHVDKEKKKELKREDAAKFPPTTPVIPLSREEDPPTSRAEEKKKRKSFCPSVGPSSSGHILLVYTHPPAGVCVCATSWLLFVKCDGKEKVETLKKILFSPKKKREEDKTNRRATSKTPLHSKKRKREKTRMEWQGNSSWSSFSWFQPRGQSRMCWTFSLPLV